MNIEIRYRTVLNRLNKYRLMFLNNSKYSLYKYIDNRRLQRLNRLQSYFYYRYKYYYSDVVYILRDNIQRLYNSYRPVYYTRSSSLLYSSKSIDVLTTTIVTAITNDIKISIATINRTAKALINKLNKIYLDIDSIDEVYRILNRFNTRLSNVIISI